MLEAAGPEAVRERAIELQRMDPAILDPAIDGVILGRHEPDDLVAQIRCPVHLLAAQYELSGVMDAQDVQRFISHAPHCTHAVLRAQDMGSMRSGQSSTLRRCDSSCGNSVHSVERPFRFVVT